MRKNMDVAKTRKKLWVHFLNWADKDKPLGYFDDSKSLNCGCILCKEGTYNNRAKNKRVRANAKYEIMQGLIEHERGFYEYEDEYDHLDYDYNMFDELWLDEFYEN